MKYLLIAGGIILVVAIAGSKLGWFGKGNIVQVSTDKVQKRAITETVSASGKVQPEVEVKLSSEVSGEIVELTVKEGDVVKQGQLLCKVRPDILKSGYEQAIASLNSQKASLAGTEQELKQAEAAFKNTEAIYKRNKELFGSKVVSASEFDAVQADYESARANLEALRQKVVGSRFGVEQSSAVVKEAGDNLARTTIYAPVDGVVSTLSVEQGERVVGTAQMAGTEIMRISNLNTMEVSVDVNESDINRISLKDTADIEIDAFLGRKFRGVVTEIASSATVTGETTDEVTNFIVKVRILPESYKNLLKAGLKNPSPFRPGLSATVDIRTEKANSVAVPIQSVTTREDVKTEIETKVPAQQTANKDNDKPKEAGPVEEYVFVYANGKVKQVKVTTGIQDDTFIQIVSGLKGGEEVVSRPFTAISKTLKDSMQVEKVDQSKLFGEEKKE